MMTLYSFTESKKCIIFACTKTASERICDRTNPKSQVLNKESVTSLCWSQWFFFVMFSCPSAACRGPELACCTLLHLALGHHAKWRGQRSAPVPTTSTPLRLVETCRRLLVNYHLHQSTTQAIYLSKRENTGPGTSVKYEDTTYSQRWTLAMCGYQQQVTSLGSAGCTHAAANTVSTSLS